MIPDLLVAAQPVVAAPGEGINSITDLLQDNVIPLVITIVGIFAFMAARKGEVSNVLTMVICIVFALAIIVFALPGPRDAIIDWFSSIIAP